MTDAVRAHHVALAATIISAYVSKNAVRALDLPELIDSVYGSLASLTIPASPAADDIRDPAVSIKKSVTPDYIICLEDGRKFKSLKRHLQTAYDLSPEAYRDKWNLPRDYPMVAPSYAAARSVLAKKMGLGHPKGVPEAEAKQPDKSTAVPPVKRGRGRPRLVKPAQTEA